MVPIIITTTLLCELTESNSSRECQGRMRPSGHYKGIVEGTTNSAHTPLCFYGMKTGQLTRAVPDLQQLNLTTSQLYDGTKVIRIP